MQESVKTSSCGRGIADVCKLLPTNGMECLQGEPPRSRALQYRHIHSFGILSVLLIMAEPLRK